MTPDEIHQWIQDRQTQQPRAAPVSRPDGIPVEDWKNRHRISVKLTEENFAELHSYRIKHNINVNAAVNLITSYFFNHVDH